MAASVRALLAVKWIVRFTGLLSLALLPERAVGQRSADTLKVDPCSVAPVEQLRFVIAAGLGRLFPVQVTRDGKILSLAEPSVAGMACPSLRVELSLRMREETPHAGGSLPAPSRGVRLKASFSTVVALKPPSAKAGSAAAGLEEASLCVHQVDSVTLDSKGPASPGATWLTPAWLKSWLESALVTRGCFDITSLVYVFLQRGGVLTPSP